MALVAQKCEYYQSTGISWCVAMQGPGDGLIKAIARFPTLSGGWEWQCDQLRLFRGTSGNVVRQAGPTGWRSGSNNTLVTPNWDMAAHSYASYHADARVRFRRTTTSYTGPWVFQRSGTINCC